MGTIFIVAGAHYTPPLRPNHEVVAAYRAALHGHDGRLLMLGVTPDLAALGTDVTAIDSSEAMIARIWPGNTECRRAIKGDWRALPFPRGSFSAAMGDGSLNATTYPDGCRQVLNQLAGLLGPRGHIAFRLFRAPDEVESPADVIAAAKTGDIGNFHAFKWRLAMALVGVAGEPNIRVAAIRDAFQQAFPDRERLAAATGWPAEQIDTIDVYRGSCDTYSFPTSRQFRAAMPSSFTEPQFAPTGSYELAERCPLVIAEVRS